MSNVTVDVEGLRTYAEFEVINICVLHESLSCVIGNILGHRQLDHRKFKKSILSFEDEEMRVVSPIDPFEGQRYIEPVYNEG